MVHQNQSASVLSVDAACKLLSNRYRRLIISYLSTKETDVAEFDELGEYIREELDAGTAADQVRISLLHIHLPKLADYGVIDYDHRSQVVRYQGESMLEELLAAAPTTN